jgi:hypothetical protein
MTHEEIKTMIQGWIEDLNSAGFDWAGLPDEMREKLEKMSPSESSAYFMGHIDALQSVINVLS